MNNLVYAQIYRTEIENRLLKEQTNQKAEESTRNANFVNANRRFNRH